MEPKLPAPDRLPDEVLNRIWQKLVVSYGHLFKSQWDGLPLDAVRADWAEELASYADKPWAIEYALAHRPERLPLTAQMFRRICGQAVDPAQSARPAEPVVRADPKRVAELVIRTASDRGRHPRQWAFDLRDRELAGQSLRRSQQMMWREALGYAPSAPINVVAESLRRSAA